MRALLPRRRLVPFVTWTGVQVSNISAMDTHLSIESDNAGNLYYGGWGGPHDLPFLAIPRDHGKTWSRPMMNRSGDPVHRGNDCTAGRCSGIWDFLDIRISKTGRLWASTSDDCVATCVTEQKVVALHAGNGFAVTDPSGPSLGTPFQYAQPPASSG